MKPTSAHGLALLALVVAIGGGIATAHNGDPAKTHLCIGSNGDVRAVAPEATCAAGETSQDLHNQDVAYLDGNRGPTSYPASKRFRRVSSQMTISAQGEMYVMQGKLVVSKPASGRPGTVTCHLDASEDPAPNDVARVTLAPGESETISLLNRVVTNGRLGETVASVIRCSSPASRYTVSFLKMAAQPMDTVSQGINVPAAGQPG